MKKKLSILTASLVIASLGFAQELTSKKGEAYLPAEGDWAIGVDVAPFLQYIGNAFNGNTSNASPTFNFTDGGLTIYGKWYRADDLAWRGRLRLLGIQNQTNIMFSADDATGAAVGAQVEDAQAVSQFQTSLGFGMEKRKGNTRLQGFYGAEVLITYGSAGEKYTYGNPAGGTSSNFGTNVNGAARLTERDYGSFYYVGVRPFIGVEYFIMPKISLGGEFGYTIGFGGASATEETWETATTSTTQKGGTNGSVTFKADNDNLSGAIKLLFHF